MGGGHTWWGSREAGPVGTLESEGHWTGWGGGLTGRRGRPRPGLLGRGRVALVGPRMPCEPGSVGALGWADPSGRACAGDWPTLPLDRELDALWRFYPQVCEGGQVHVVLA